MRIIFEDDTLQRAASDRQYRPKGWGPDVLTAYRKKIQILAAAVDERDLYALRSLRLEKLSGDRAGTSSIRLNKQYRLIIKFRTVADGRVVIVVEMVDYH
ncbi:type II toxin-antitoxin system RelE/ParE family toxin [Gordonia sp. (in: high G+C Gram-positive bacteria)]|uniref:type II toxin-antitoxin system RelE/ParE family toxin n=1 Tax=Gordonia sp. (in: high G+C Gram-positive bacteria) TaxID=84139 RepID=UPI0016968719|nr:type II toxin-antitoxin system RelE/ParE family toxin [Gordonia sp. (in: high G+C Gram-positive bacteria)]NLG45849.1 plasmid maintenance system killer protein [Gordonia sp. (in: high G+C Gram-positive bacteria)]